MKRILSLYFLFWLISGVFAQENLLCQGAYWSEDEAAIFMKKTALEWTTQADWEKRAKVIRKGIIDGMKLEQMPARTASFNTIITVPGKWMDTS